MIPEVKVNHWKWCETQGNSPHVKWEWCEVNEEVDVYTALWLASEFLIDFDKYIHNLSQTDWAKKFLSDFISEGYYNDILTEEGHDTLHAYLLGIQHYKNPKDIIYIDEKLYTNEND